MYKLNKKNTIVVGIILIIIVIIVLIYIYTKDDEKELITYEQNIQENILKNENTEEKVSKKEIVVHISGEVKTEGIIFLNEGDRISNAIEKAGGLKESADISKINLAYVLEDGMKVYIPNINEKEEKNNMQDNINSDNTQEYISGTVSKEKNQTSKNEKNTTKKVNINTANQTELETLTGIGPSTALKIINYRNEKGKFNSIEDLKNVSGIGDAKFNNVKDSICVN